MMRVLLSLILSGVLIVAFQNCGGNFYTYEPMEVEMNSLSEDGNAAVTPGQGSVETDTQVPSQNSNSNQDQASNSNSNQDQASNSNSNQDQASNSNSNQDQASNGGTQSTNKAVTYSIQAWTIMPVATSDPYFTPYVLFDASGDISGKQLYFCVMPGSNCAPEDYKLITQENMLTQHNVVRVVLVDQDVDQEVFPTNVEFLFADYYFIHLAEKVNGVLKEVSVGVAKGADCGTRLTSRGGFVARRGASGGYSAAWRMEARSSVKDTCKVYGKITPL